MANTNLLKFLHDMLTDETVRIAFNEDCMAVMGRGTHGRLGYDLDGDHQRAVLTMNKDTVLQEVLGVISNWPGSAFPPCDWHRDRYRIQYPNPAPEIELFDPLSHSLNSGPVGGRFELTVFGQSFSPNATEIELRHVNSGVVLTTSHPTMAGSTFRCSRVTVRVRVPADSAVGDYRVTLFLNRGTRHEVTIVATENFRLTP